MPNKDSGVEVQRWELVAGRREHSYILLKHLLTISFQMVAAPAVSCFGKKKTATAVANAKEGKGLIRLNGQPLSLVEPETLKWKIFEPLLVVGEDKFSTVDIRCRVSGGGHTSQVYAIRQAIAKALVAYYAKYYDAASALELRQLFVAYDRTLLIADTRRMEPKKFGGRGARARRKCFFCCFLCMWIDMTFSRAKILPLSAEWMVLFLMLALRGIWRIIHFTS